MTNANQLTLICIVFHFELKVACVRLHRQHATLQVFLFTIMGVFKGNVSLGRGKTQRCVYNHAMLNAAQVVNKRNLMGLFDWSGEDCICTTLALTDLKIINSG